MHEIGEEEARVRIMRERREGRKEGRTRTEREDLLDALGPQ